VAAGQEQCDSCQAAVARCAELRRLGTHLTVLGISVGGQDLLDAAVADLLLALSAKLS
jgi:hypothetical protein